MNRDQKIDSLRKSAPLLVQVSLSQDMGYEFNAIVPNGVIYSEPGMLLEYSGGLWPPDSWGEISEQLYNQKLENLLLNETWSVIPWDALDDDEVDFWHESANRNACHSVKNEPLY